MFRTQINNYIDQETEEMNEPDAKYLLRDGKETVTCVPETRHSDGSTPRTTGHGVKEINCNFWQRLHLNHS